MKIKNLIYFISVLLAVTSVSCDDFLDSPATSANKSEDVYSNYELAKGAVDAIKFSFTETNSHRSRYIPWYGINTDCERLLSSSTGDKLDLATYNASASNGQMNSDNNVWAKMYEGIERANLAVEGLKAYGNIDSDEEMGYLYGEALTLRAVLYAELVKAWGDIPARFEPVTSATTYIAKSDRDTIYKQLISDLEIAESYVPWPNDADYTTTTEQVSKSFVKGLRARFALNAAGYSQRPDVGYLSTSGYFNQTELLTIVKDECEDIINQGCNELIDFQTIFENNCSDVIDAGAESIWEIPFGNTRGRVMSAYAPKHSSIDQYTGYANSPSVGVTPNLWYDFDEADTRREVSVVPYLWGTADSDGYAAQELSSVSNMYFGKYRYEWATRTITTSDDGINKIYMRYADIVLMAAEAYTQLNDVATAKTYLKMIRERAFDEADWTEKVTNYLAAITTQDEMMRAIQDEHKFEFSGEMLRKEALIRWGKLGDFIDEAKARMYALQTFSAGTYGDQSFDYSDVSEKLYYKYADDGLTLDIYGLNRGEVESPGDDYEETTWISDTKIDSDKVIELMYQNDPDTKQYWPIWQTFIDNSNGTLTNDYGY